MSSGGDGVAHLTVNVLENKQRTDELQSLLRCTGGGVSKSWFAVEDAVECFGSLHGSTVSPVVVAMAEVGGVLVGFRGFDTVVNGGSSGSVWPAWSSSSEGWVSHRSLDPPRLVSTGPVKVSLLVYSERSGGGWKGIDLWVGLLGRDSTP
ncbi:hypothetical protein ISN45_Aa07g038880 [Arabidopsis thaliana x Arabidopsis arenosa]|uniref:Uncharacterized protein n=1 Tax=Arabidopsis thaliana x Arabidopsis arenosa TaxID=1240361 RepID=A0A8T1YDQ8_9BRAS|nr:hypothetical protein ISN45_Aa07g038880 [Arabidopsis thaliana x Arabidopsis arenosa]